LYRILKSLPYLYSPNEKHLKSIKTKSNSMRKKFYLFLTALLALTGVRAQVVVPQFSTEDAPVWYTLEFKTGGHFLEDQGSGADLQTANAEEGDAQRWQLIGSRDNFLLKSKLGHYVGYGGSYFRATATAADAVALKLADGATEGTFELQRVGTTGKSMNQWGGTGVGAKLGEWDARDPNNPLWFNEVEASDPLYLDPVFSTDEAETYFMLRFANGGNNLSEQGASQQAVVASPKNTNAQLWKFVGTADNFQLISRNGYYATVKQGTATNGQTGNMLSMQTTPDAAGFKIIATKNSTYAGAWEIQYNGISSQYNTLNQWGGAQVGVSVGCWSAGDGNNPLYLVNPASVELPFEVEGISGYRPENDLTLWYTLPAGSTNAADRWMEYSLPIGNGQFGASIFGGVACEEIQYNEKTLWSGTHADNGTEYGDYENFGSLLVSDVSRTFGYESETAVKDYYRQLDLTNATASVHFKSPDKSVAYTREYIASYPDKVVALRFAADKPGQISLHFAVAPGKPGLRATAQYADGEGFFGGKLETVSYNSRFRVVPTGGEMTTDARKGITVTGADEVLVVLAGATDFDAYAPTYVSGTDALAATVQTRVEEAARKGWSELYAAHVADYRRYFNRVDFCLDGAANTLPTDELVKQYAKRTSGTEPYALMLEQLYFHYGRYLEISSSRGVDLPSNLQGIWNNSSEPAWNADIHANINVQMNYWPAEPTNLSEMHLPFLNYITNMATNHTEWAGYAHDAGQSRGWTCYTENNIFGGVGSFLHNYVIANAWYCTHLWQHYRYTLDKDFLKRAFPTMLSASQFWIDRLKLDGDGTYVCPNEYSPEQGPTEDGVAHAQQLVAELFANTLAAIDVLGGEAEISAEDLSKLQDRYAKLDRGLATETYTGNWGGTVNGVKTGDVLLREWKTSNYTVGQNGHRHMSHLMCVYPFSQVTPGSPYFEAALNSMKLRGDASTGWSMGWKINLWARVLDGDRAHDILELALRHHSVGGGGVYYNLYDAHTPFQIDGNFGACAGIAEMLMQSHTDTIQILPALPAVWKDGHVSGLKAVGDFTVDVAWKDGKPTRATLTNHQGRPCYVKYPGLADVAVYVNGVGQEMEPGQSDVRLVSGQAGDIVVLDFDGTYEPAGVSNSRADSRIGIAVKDRTVTVSGTDVAQVSVTDLGGRMLMQTSRRSFRLAAEAGQVVIVSVKRTDGTSDVQKVVL